MTSTEIQIRRSGMTFTDKVVIITGGSRGIVQGCAHVFVDAGAKVMICSRNTEEDGDRIARELNGLGPGECVFRQCDVSQPEDICALIDATIQQFNRLDCLINNAGYHPPVSRIHQFTLKANDQ